MHSPVPTTPTTTPAPSSRLLRRLAPVALLAAGLTAVTLTGPAPAVPTADSQRAAATVGAFGKGQPSGVVVRRGPSREVGMRFAPKVAGKVVGIRYYKPLASKAATPRSATLWSRTGKKLARTKITPVKGTGWQSVKFSSKVRLAKGRLYVVSVHTRNKGIHAATPGDFAKGHSNAQLRVPGDRNGWTKVGKGATFPRTEARGDTNFWVDVRFKPSGTTQDPTPTPTPTPNPPGAWPGPDNTGVPAGTTLTPYTGSCTISSPVTITAVDATGKCNALTIRTTGVVIDKSLVPRVDSTFGDGNSSVTITDSDVRAGSWSDGALWGYNITARRVDVTGGQHSFHCNNNCELTDSWLHDQYNPDGGSYHNNAFISNGGHTMVVRHNTLHCTAILNSTDGGCTADVSLFGDFDPIDDVLIENNLLRANNSSISYCAYGGQKGSKPYGATNVRFINNVFERGANRKCGVYGPVTSFERGAVGNVWSGNVWDSGEAVNP